MADEGSAGADAQLASEIADKSLEHPTETLKAADDLANGAGEEEGEEEDDDEDEQVAGTTTTSKKKKKKPRKKKKKAAADNTNTTTTSTSTEPQAAASTSISSTSQPPKSIHPQDIQSLLNQLALSQGSGPKKEGKAQADYKFWNTQPVPKFQEPNLLQTTTSSASGDKGEKALPEGPILPDKVCKASAKPDPAPLKDGFEWCLVDLEVEEEVKELYDLLDNHYVEDADASFRFRYSVEFLRWALKPPGWRREWHIGVRTSTSTQQEGGGGAGKKGKLVAFIAGIPVTLKVGESKNIKATEINFLAIHRKLRGKRLAPELIKEVTRRCYINDIFQALYTAGTLLPTPVSTCRYFHRSLDWEHLYKTGFSHLPPGSTETRQKYKYKVEAQPQLKGWREMRSEDVPAVRDLLVRYLERFHLRQEWSVEEVRHWFCSEESRGVVWSFVVEDGEGKVVDFVSFYLLEVSFADIVHPALLWVVAAVPSAATDSTEKEHADKT